MKFKINIIGYGESSPMENHRVGEIATDNETKEFFVHEMLVVTNGTESIETACGVLFGVYAS